MTLDQFIGEITKVMGQPKPVSRKTIEDYPDLKIYTVKDYQPHRGKDNGND